MLEPILENIIGGARLQEGSDRPAARRGHDDNGNVEGTLAQHLQGTQGRKARHAVVRKDGIGPMVEPSGHVGDTIGWLQLQVKAGVRQLLRYQLKQ